MPIHLDLFSLICLAMDTVSQLPLIKYSFQITFNLVSNTSTINKDNIILSTICIIIFFISFTPLKYIFPPNYIFLSHNTPVTSLHFIQPYFILISPYICTAKSKYPNFLTNFIILFPSLTKYSYFKSIFVVQYCFQSSSKGKTNWPRPRKQQKRVAKMKNKIKSRRSLYD